MSDLVPKDIPTFAVVGKVNMGKSSVLATLLEVDDDQIIRVSATPGETTRCQPLPVEFDGREMIRFIDTPGFARPLEAMRAIEQLHAEAGGSGSPGLAAIEAFVEEYAGSGEFEDEVQLLRPLVAGAGLLYVIDPSKPLRDTFIAEMEILRWTGRQRMALLNEKGDDPEFRDEWKNRLGSYFNLVRTFDAHEARFEERRRLLKSLLEIDEDHRALIEETIAFLEDEWSQRRDESVEAIITFLEKCLGYRIEKRVEERDMEVPHRREKLGKELTKQYYEKIAKMEKETVEKVLHLYRHHLGRVEVTATDFTGIDLEQEETWQKWGLSRSQLAIAGGVTGGTGGLAIDASTGFLTHGLGTFIGAVGGAAAAFWKGSELPDLALDLQKGAKFAKGEGTALRLGPPKNENFAWILLDSVLGHYREIVSRAHGKREELVLDHKAMEGGIVQTIKGEDRRILQKWFASCAKGKVDRGLEPEVFTALNRVLSDFDQERS
ncbi:GTPase/DUF3482 domain-containing protein [Roseibacillus ishigakijimensis]|uniref:GTPase/DUF3482 domain-containing protein n=1 Tax=Roseibacillus ishigakijimensis TaxID=454146 RepID=A0A934RRA1_9BACT|nr:GTPase/DUF3482 domain-containing protein [Roseibacillus ishigakijimensis]MBK1834462.1 GTPase/DUF3482 domain-containing protein [Roseibacillus ishigakijimensis]